MADILHLPFERDLLVRYLLCEAYLAMKSIKALAFKSAEQSAEIKQLISKVEGLLADMGDAATFEARYLYHRVHWLWRKVSKIGT